jgi:class 3 adenylate cyclase
MIAMRNLVPPFITNMLREGRLDGAFPAAGLFLDMSGFTRMTEALMTHGREGSEALAVIMRRVFDPLIEHVEEFGGFVAGFEGDAFHALFPAPAGDLREAARRAVAAGWVMQQWMAAHPEQETPYGRFAISAKVGVALGDAEWGILTSSTGQRALYYFRGPAIEDSAAAQGQAGRGEIILDKRPDSCGSMSHQSRPPLTRRRLTRTTGWQAPRIWGCRRN